MRNGRYETDEDRQGEQLGSTSGTQRSSYIPEVISRQQTVSLWQDTLSYSYSTTGVFADYLLKRNKRKPSRLQKSVTLPTIIIIKTNFKCSFQASL